MRLIRHLNKWARCLAGGAMVLAARWPRLAALTTVFLVMAVSAVASARVGGGQSYSGGGSSSSSGSYSSSGGGGDSAGDAIFGFVLQCLLELCIECPQVGIPLLILVLIAWLVLRYSSKKIKEWTTGSSNRSRDQYSNRRADMPNAHKDKDRPEATSAAKQNKVDDQNG